MIDNATIVDPRTGGLQPGMTIEMRDGKIVRVVPTASAGSFAGRRIDASGKFVVPGYNNMHSHALGPTDPSGALALMLAEGVTGFRQMSSSRELARQRRNGTLPLGLNTPSLLTMGGPVLSPFNAGSPSAAAITIAQAKADGADFIKIAVVRPDVFHYALAKAREEGLPALGHIQNGVDAARASREGMRSIEHLGPTEPIWIACSRDKEALLAESALHPPLPEPYLPVPVPVVEQVAMELFINKELINPAAGAKPSDVERFQRELDSYDDARCRALIAEFKANSTWNVPTLVRIRTQYLADDPAYQTDPFLAYMPEQHIKDWQDSVAKFRALPEAMKATYRAAYVRDLFLTKMMYDSGVPMTMGTDDGDLALPGLTMAQEFDELERAGIPPLGVLQMATINAATFLGRSDRMGLVATGYDADLVLLDANPLLDVQALRRIAGVVRSGYYNSRMDLDALKARVAQGRGYLK
jgi:imidazolonepropionase-like amidohydrolase